MDVELSIKKIGNQYQALTTKRYVVPLYDEDGKYWEINAYGIEEITELEEIDMINIANIFHIQPEYIKRPHGKVDLLVGTDCCVLLPEVVKTIEKIQLLRNQFGFCVRGCVHSDALHTTKKDDSGTVKNFSDVTKMGEEHRNDYVKQTEDKVTRGIAPKSSNEEIENSTDPVRYMQHHELVRPDSPSTPMHIVFNGIQLLALIAIAMVALKTIAETNRSTHGKATIITIRYSYADDFIQPVPHEKDTFSLGEDVQNKLRKQFVKVTGYKLQDERLARCPKPLNTVGEPILITLFDASIQAYEACVYVQLKLITALDCRLRKTIQQEMNFIYKNFLDVVNSAIMRDQIPKELYGCDLFIATKFAEIQIHSEQNEWWRMAATDNPADIRLTRPYHIGPGSVCQRGPDFLSLPTCREMTYQSVLTSSRKGFSSYLSAYQLR
ncbi:uncharacterized protein LOC122364075 [Amphibalanus amphitrite]|uniref:uncharacterized protein LOC122364075 n=1 Tax=Amphibalanus amphitrite TaxID=1232801 RepID=UPI001C8FAA72|nr:uncharacterized protein LOC122364075 [Amphibalanus amphitrite]